ncbi:hypothetical protein PsAD5_03766 [Pseudovibrio sp. Ad5]|nr:hypothetical protein PsAD5_03766 [Pseudovibrio sp. Ad5]
MISTLTRYALLTLSMDTALGGATMNTIEGREPRKPAGNISDSSLIGFGV